VIGNKKNARIAASLYDSGKDETEGWHVLGSGGTRTCWLGPDGVAYKVTEAGNRYGWSAKANAREYRRVKKYRGPKWKTVLEEQLVRVPDATLWQLEDRAVLAMEYVEDSGIKVECGTYPDYDICKCRKFGEHRICFSVLLDDYLTTKYKMDDMFWGNVILDKSGWFNVIDLGW